MLDVVIKNGRVIDFEDGTDEIKTIAMRDGVFVEYDPNEDVKKTINAEGCIVCPGLIDGHTHVYYEGTGVLSTKADVVNPPNCVTSVVDAGSTSAWNFESFYRTEIINSVTDIYAMLHPCEFGVHIPPAEEIEDPRGFNTAEILRMFKKYPEVLKGLKIRMSKGTAGKFGNTPIEKAEEIAEEVRKAGHHCIVMCHYSDLADGVTLDQFVNTFQKGDVICHLYHPDGNSIFDESGKIADCVWKARERGVLFDSSRARINHSLANILKAAEEGFYPDIMSTDYAKKTIYWKPSYSLIWSMCLFLNVGMPLEDVIKSVTYTPAKAFDILENAGTLKIGRPGNVAILKVIDQKKTYADLFGTSIEGEKLIVPMATCKDGQCIYQQIFMDNELS